MSRHASVVTRFRLRLRCSQQAIADLWECDREDIQAAERGEKMDRWIEDRFWFFTGLHWLHVDAYTTNPKLIKDTEDCEKIAAAFMWLKRKVKSKY